MLCVDRLENNDFSFLEISSEILNLLLSERNNLRMIDSSGNKHLQGTIDIKEIHNYEVLSSPVKNEDGLIIDLRNTGVTILEKTWIERTVEFLECLWCLDFFGEELSNTQRRLQLIV